ncbi:MAG TPA: SRPBCC family protein [Candidatus Dormibacteraeota bacterium]
MPNFTFRVKIGAPPETVFAQIADLTRHPEWGHAAGRGQSLESVVAVSATQLEKDSEYRSHANRFGSPVEARLRVVEFDPPKEFGFEVDEPAGWFRHFHHRFTIAPAPSGCTLTRTVEFGPEPPAALRAPMHLFYLLVARPVNLRFLQRFALAIESDQQAVTSKNVQSDEVSSSQI